MSMSDPIADLLTRIRNAYMAGHKKVVIPASKIKLGIGEVLKKEGYINGIEKVDTDKGSQLEVELKYSKFGRKVIHEIKRVSKPSRRVYVGSKEIRKVKGGLGIAIISTSKGVVSDRIAKQEGVGGELLCTVW